MLCASLLSTSYLLILYSLPHYEAGDYYYHSTVENIDAHRGEVISLEGSQLTSGRTVIQIPAVCSHAHEATCSTSNCVLYQPLDWVCFVLFFLPLPNISSLLSPPSQCPGEQKEAPQPRGVPLSGWRVKSRLPSR